MPRPAMRFFALRDGERVGGPHRVPALAVAGFFVACVWQNL